MNEFDPTILIAIVLGGAILFSVFRYITLWYLNINKRVRLMQENNNLLKKLLKHFTGEDYKLLNEEEKENIPLKENKAD